MLSLAEVGCKAVVVVPLQEDLSELAVTASGPAKAECARGHEADVTMDQIAPEVAKELVWV